MFGEENMALSDSYRELFLKQTNRNPVSARSIATRAKLHQSSLIHFAVKGGQMRYDHQVALLDAAGIDRLASVLAVEVLHDPESYENPAIHMIAGMLPPLLKYLTVQEMDAVDPFHANEMTVISEHIAKYLIQIVEKRLARRKVPYEHFTLDFSREAR